MRGIREKSESERIMRESDGDVDIWVVTSQTIKWSKKCAAQSFFCLKKNPDQHVATKSRQFNVATYKVHFSAFNRRNPDRRSFK